MTSQRNAGIDALKAFAICGVVICHFAAGSMSYYQPYSLGWLSGELWGSFGRFPVSAFLMASGALLLNPAKQFSLKLLFSKYLPRILIALFFWAAAYELADLVLFQGFSAATIRQSLSNLLLFKHHFQLYFLHIIIIVYLALPLLRVFVAHASQTEYRYVLVLWFVLGIVLPFVMQFYPFTLLKGIPLQYPIKMTYSAIGYALAGYYLIAYPAAKLRPWLAVLVGGFLITWLGMMILPDLNYSFWEGMSPGVALTAIGAFAVLDILFRGKQAERLLSALAAASFCIFLVHDFFNIILHGLHISYATFHPLISIPLFSAVEIAASYGVYLVLKRIPLAKKYLI